MSDGFLSFYLDDDGVAKKTPDYQITICFETEEEMNRFSEKMKNEDKYRWHDLVKNPEDLPETNDRVVVKVKWEGGDSNYYTDLCYHKKWQHENLACNYRIIAWKYIEPFEGSE